MKRKIYSSSVLIFAAAAMAVAQNYDEFTYDKVTGRFNNYDIVTMRVVDSPSEGKYVLKSDDGSLPTLYAELPWYGFSYLTTLEDYFDGYKTTAIVFNIEEGLLPSEMMRYYYLRNGRWHEGWPDNTELIPFDECMRKWTNAGVEIQTVKGNVRGCPVTFALFPAAHPGQHPTIEEGYVSGDEVYYTSWVVAGKVEGPGWTSEVRSGVEEDSPGATLIKEGDLDGDGVDEISVCFSRSTGPKSLTVYRIESEYETPVWIHDEYGFCASLIDVATTTLGSVRPEDVATPLRHGAFSFKQRNRKTGKVTTIKVNVIKAFE